MTLHAYNPNSGAFNAGGEWTAHTSLCKPRGAVGGGGAKRYRVTDQPGPVTCKACLAALEAQSLRAAGFPPAAARAFHNRHED